ncbi:MAG: hypothetical protein ACHREM_23360, partial [Polyangiales bacterium]
SGNCAPTTATCKDATTSIGTDGTEHACTPYVCGTTGSCLQSCATTNDCSGGNVCELSSSLCVTPSTTSSGGCGVARTTSERDEGVAWVIAALGAAIAIGRRRRSCAGA